MITLGTGLIVTINDRSSEIEGKESFCKKEMGGGGKGNLAKAVTTAMERGWQGGERW